MMEYWEPVRFKAGDRVKIRLNPECPIPHSKDADGVSGSVSLFQPPALFRDRGHSYVVHFDRRLPRGKTGEGVTHIYGGCYAAVELEPLTEAER